MKVFTISAFILVLSSCIEFPVDITENATYFRIDFQSGFDSSLTNLHIDNQPYFEGTLSTNDVLSVATQVPISISKGMHSIKCTIDKTTTADIVINVPDSLVIGIRIDPQLKIPEFDLYEAGNFPFYD
jgi:hypothetical protein